MGIRHQSVCILFLLSLAAISITALAQLSSGTISGTVRAESSRWIEASSRGVLPAEMYFSNAHGRLGVLLIGGSVEMKGHPFFEPQGSNSRACVTCHQPSNAMSVSVEAVRERWRATKGEDPIFAAVDGSNNDGTVSRTRSARALFLERFSEKPARPLCAYPKVAKYSGSGEVTNAASFRCEEPKR